MSDPPPPKRHCSSRVKSFTTYYPTKKYSSHISHSPSHSTVAYCYPLSLLPLATIRVYQSREFTPMRAPCRKCACPAEIGLILQKVFLTVERLVSGGVGKLSQKEKNEENHWTVNYEAGILEPTLFGGGGFKSGKLADSPYFPFEGERGVEEFGLFIRGLYGIVLDGNGDDGGGDAGGVMKGKGKGEKARLETPRKLSKASYRITPPASSPRMFSRTFMSPPPSRHSETPAGTPEEEDTIPDFNDLKVLFPLLDKLERGSFAAAQMMEAFADVVIGQRCGNCCDWAVQKPGAKESPVSSGTLEPESEADSENEDDRSSGTLFAERTGREHTPSTLGVEKRPVLQSTPENASPPSGSINDSTAKFRVVVTRNLRTPKRSNRADPEEEEPVSDPVHRWYAFITPRAERRIRLENPGEDVKATIKEEEEEEEAD
ncbi:hypothetical protein C7212DRAFT_283377 [Tuber magnatum]|uniref:Uncharacterized protein n=1 Tax=Tuber magnatum TaxID=42249 RepID=A0A317SM99_9PEZI|nr:hypothetical protein C7212DRAFT_283377 [Tuber magnatum]